MGRKTAQIKSCRWQVFMRKAMSLYRASILLKSDDRYVGGIDRATPSLQNKKNDQMVVFKNGAEDRTRTDDIWYHKPAL